MEEKANIKPIKSILNPTFPTKTESEISIIFFKAFEKKTKEACYKATSISAMISKPLGFSLFDYLGIDEVRL